jgi:hypothetical protein
VVVVVVALGYEADVLDALEEVKRLRECYVAIERCKWRETQVSPSVVVEYIVF